MSNWKQNITKGYNHAHHGWINPNIPTAQQIESMETRIDDLEDPTVVLEKNTIISQNITTNNISTTNITTTQINAEDTNLGRYIYLNSENPYDEMSMDSGMVLNLESMPNLSFNVNGAGFTSSTVAVDASTGLLPNQFLAVQSEKNKGLYQVASHAGGIITIKTNPDEPFLKSSFTVESANGTVRAVKIGVIRGTSNDVAEGLFDDLINGDISWDTFQSSFSGTPEWAFGHFAPLSYHTISYDTYDPTYKNVTLTDASDQIKMNQVTLTSGDLIPKTHTIPTTLTGDTFIMEDALQTMTNKTMTSATNNVVSRGLWVGNGTSSVSTYSSGAPTAGQVLMANGLGGASFQTLFSVSAGNNITITPGTGGGATNTSITIAGTDNPQNKDTTTETQTVTGPQGTPGLPGSFTMGLPGLPGLPGITTMVAGGFVAGGGLILPGAPGTDGEDGQPNGGLYTDTIRTYSGASGPTFPEGLVTNIIHSYAGSSGTYFSHPVLTDTIKYNHAYEWTENHGMHHHGNVIIDGNAYLNGNVAIQGTLTTVNSEQLNVKDRWIYQGMGNTVALGVSNGIITNTQPSIFSIPLSGAFVAGVDGVSDSAVSCGDDPFAWDDLIQISGSQYNDGIYQVANNTTSYLAVKGQLSSTSEPFVQKRFQNETITGSVYATKIKLSGLEFNAGATGINYLRGDNTNSLTRNTILYKGIGNTTTTSTVTLELLPYNGSSTITLELRADPVNSEICSVNIGAFSVFVSTYPNTHFRIWCGSEFVLPARRYTFTIPLFWDGCFEDCFLISDHVTNSLYIMRKSGQPYPSGGVTITHYTDNLPVLGYPAMTQYTFTKF